MVDYARNAMVRVWLGYGLVVLFLMMIFGGAVSVMVLGRRSLMGPKKIDPNKLDELHLRLLALQYLCISISSEDGHRWLRCGSGGYEGEFNLDEKLREKGYSANGKIYPNLLGALDYVDYLLGLVGSKSLLEVGREIVGYYDLDVEFDGEDWSNRVQKCERWYGGIC